MHRIFSEIQSYQQCGVAKDSVGNASVNLNSIPCEISLEDLIKSSNQAKTVNRSSDCRMLLNEGSKCDSCKRFEKSKAKCPNK